MKIKFPSLLTLMATAFTASLLSAPVYSDDTDIFVEIEEEGAADYQPNVLFIFDTSGSMGGTITIREDYDPTFSYGSSDPSRVYVYNSSLTTYIRSISASQNSCSAMTSQIADRVASNDGDPTWYGRAGYWQIRSNRSDRWRSICSSCSSFKSTSIVDCREDQGKHGIDDDSTAVYTRNYTNGSPYTTSSSSAFNWSGINSYYYVSANYHDYLQNTTAVSRSKIDIMKDEAIDLVNNFEGLNFGLMRFDNTSENGDGSDDGGYVIQEFTDITSTTAKNTINSKITALTANGYTPLAESLWEAALYYQGNSPIYGNVTPADGDAFDGSKYKTPIVNSCQKNHIVLLTDGQPVRDGGTDSIIRGKTGKSCSHSDNTTSSNNTCLDELSEYLFNEDQYDGFDGDQTISTYTIGFAIDMDLLQQTAAKGGGKYYTAGNSTELKAAFTEIIADILDTNTTFTAPAVTVNAYNNLQHKNELYYAIFKPKSRTRWPGNIKRYQITADGEVVDVNGINAVDENTGFFQSGAQSWWSEAIDGDKVESGGFSEQLQTISTMYTYTSESAPTGAVLNTSDHIFSTSNTKLTNELLGLPDGTADAEREKLIQWALGVDVDDVDPEDNTHNFVADPLHTRPVVVTYGGTSTAPDDVVFSMTNMGMLHAIDTDNGNEIFRFMPQELLPNIDTLYEDFATEEKVYGLDGPISVWRKESNDADFNIEPADGDKVYLYFGMRRGGNNYYAMDVTDRYNPKLLWRIEGGSGQFSNLGQSWSAPQLANVNWNCDSNGDNCQKKTVLFFGGGYDNVHDTATGPTSGDVGSTIYMVDAETGDLIWSAGNSGDDLSLPLQNSIPSDLVLGDMTGDGNVDVLLAVDIMGHFWRVDFNEETTSVADFATGGMIANLQGTSGSELRRFYHAPGVAAVSPPGESSYFIVSAGSGYRASPKEEDINDRFYTLFVDSVFGPPTDNDGNIEYTTVEDDDLLDATNEVADRTSNAPNGFYIRLSGQGEKVLSTPFIFSGTVFFTTYLTSGTPNQCGVNIGSGRLWAVGAGTGVGLIGNDRNIDLKHGGIPSSPVLVLVGNDDGATTPVLCIGTECFKDGDAGGIPLPNDVQLNKTYWREE
ncbi:MAG: PilC/PilY family type IV pilus protein [Candidatus Pelagadaptatus aseana]|uniref:pilus assembly protein n=1 Tax=Candidatus Pelagadaptatus aseana TaxID=3120508 RepID=UPI0039B30958